MDKTHSPLIEDIRWYKARVERLEKSNRWHYAALETLASMVDLHKDVKQNADPGALFKIAGEKLGELLDFQTLAFFQVALPNSSFVLTDCFPNTHNSQIQNEVDQHVENGNFAWAIKQNRALTMDCKFSSGKLILHSISTKHRVLGLFAGELMGNINKIPSEKLTLISVVLNNTAHAIENGYLFKRVNNLNETLEKAVYTRTQKLEEQSEKLEREVSERKRVRNAYQKLAKQNENILNSTDEGILGVDVNCNITFVNSQGAQLTGYEPDEMIGLPVFSLFHPSGAVAQHNLNDDNPVNIAIDTNSTISRKDEIFWKKCGQKIPVEYTFKAIQESGKPMGALMTFRNIAEQKKIEEEKKLNEENLLRSNKALHDFAFIASHDLQEPLRKLLMFSNRLKTNCSHHMDGNAKGYLDNIEGLSYQMRELLDGLLEFSAITTDASQFQKTDLFKVISAVLSDLIDPIVKSGARIKVGPLPIIDADIIQMRRLFYNLLTNCLQFQKPDEALVVRVSGHDQGNGKWAISINDNGTGFDAKHIDKIFKPFKQLHSSSEYGGQGIGLTICQEIAIRHRGSVSVISTPDEGSTFTVTLPENQSSPCK